MFSWYDRINLLTSFVFCFKLFLVLLQHASWIQLFCSFQIPKLIKNCPNLSCIETVSSRKHADQLNRIYVHQNRSPLSVLVQVNTSGEEQKGEKRTYRQNQVISRLVGQFFLVKLKEKLFGVILRNDLSFVLSSTHCFF